MKLRTEFEFVSQEMSLDSPNIKFHFNFEIIVTCKETKQCCQSNTESEQIKPIRTTRYYSFFSSPRLPLCARVALRTKYRVPPAWLIKHLSCRLPSQRHYKRSSRQFLTELVQVLLLMPRFRETLCQMAEKGSNHLLLVHWKVLDPCVTTIFILILNFLVATL